MNDCCMKSFVAMGFRTGFALSEEGDRHTCPTCGQVFAMVKVPPAGTDPPNRITTHLEWRPVVH